MKIGIASVRVPFISGGTEAFVGSLHRELIRRGYEADVLTIPFKWYPPEQILRSMESARLTDLTEVNGQRIDRLIALKFPAYFFPHPDKVCWIFHQHRQAYELFATPYGDLDGAETGRRVAAEIRAWDSRLPEECPSIFGQSRTVCERLLQYNGIRSEVLYHPPEDYERFNCQDYDEYILYPGRFDPIKRQHLIIEAMKDAPKGLRLVLIGPFDSPYGHETVKRIRSEGLEDRIQVLGVVSSQEKIRLYANALAVYNGVYEEDYGYVTLEAFLASKAVITHVDSGGPLEFVEHGRNGFVTSPTPEAIRECLVELTAGHRLPRELGARARETIDEVNISWDYIIDRILTAPTAGVVRAPSWFPAAKVAFFSPLPPKATGIAPYARCISQALANLTTVHLFDTGDVAPPGSFCTPHIDFGASPEAIADLDEYDACVYNLGNNPFFHLDIYKTLLRRPGIVVLHDTVLYFLMAGLGVGGLAKELAVNHGGDAIRKVWEILRESPDRDPLRFRHPERYPLLRRVLNNATAMIVHSRAARDYVEEHGYRGPIAIVPLPYYPESVDTLGPEERERLRAQHGIRPGEVVLGCPGFIGRTKRMDIILEAVRRLNPHWPLKLLIVGEGENLRPLIDQRELGNVAILTGYVDEFDRYLQVMDVVINLRYPSMGEASATVIQAMSQRKPCVVTNDAWFSELPDDVVCKVGYDEEELDQVIETLKALLSDEALRVALGRRARAYVEVNHSPTAAAQSYMELIRRTSCL